MVVRDELENWIWRLNKKTQTVVDNSATIAVNLDILNLQSETPVQEEVPSSSQNDDDDIVDALDIVHETKLVAQFSQLISIVLIDIRREIVVLQITSHIVLL